MYRATLIVYVALFLATQHVRVHTFQLQCGSWCKINRLGAASTCQLGMKSRAIKDFQIKTSSVWDSRHAGKFARLDEQRTTNRPGAWSSKQNDLNQWIQIDLIRPRMIAGFVTQGRPEFDQWVNTLKVSCGKSTVNFHTVTEDGKEKVFDANYDTDTKIYNWLPEPLVCRYLRFNPQSWTKHISMRLEILGGDCL